MATKKKATKKVVKKAVEKSVKKAEKKVAKKETKSKGYVPRWSPDSPVNQKIPDRIQRAIIPELGGERCIYLKSEKSTDKEGWRKADVSLSGQTVPGFARKKKDGSWEWKRRDEISDNAEKAWESRLQKMVEAVESAVASKKKSKKVAAQAVA